MKIALLADTHATWYDPSLPGNLYDRLSRIDTILHAGDFVCIDLYDKIERMADLIAVHGNADEPEIVKRLPAKQMVSISGLTIGLIHGHQPPEVEGRYKLAAVDYALPRMDLFYRYLIQELPDAEVIVFGHFHKAMTRRYEGRLFINPGSASARAEQRSFATLEIDTYDLPNPQVDIIRF